MNNLTVKEIIELMGEEEKGQDTWSEDLKMIKDKRTKITQKLVWDGKAIEITLTHWRGGHTMTLHKWLGGN